MINCFEIPWIRPQVRGLVTASLLMGLFTIPTLGAPCTGGDIQGRVFRDYNADGDQSSGNTEPGIAGVIITATSDDGTSTSCETVADGSYGIDSPTGGFPIRLEASLPSGAPWDCLEPGVAAATSVRFVSTATAGVDIGFNDPLDFCQSNPEVLATCFLQGDPLAPGSNASMGDTLVAVDYNRTAIAPEHIAVGNQVGAVWGLAYQRSSQSLFVASVLRRHAGFGPLGHGGIYRIDYSGGSPVVSNFLDVTSIGIPIGIDPRTQPGEDLPGSGPTGNEPGLDRLAYEEVGKVGFGDIDIEEGTGRLWAMNLADSSLYAMDIGPAGNIPTSATQFPLPAVTCTDGAFRPWAVKSHRGRIYVGGVCSNEFIAPYPAPSGTFVDFPNLVGHVYSMDPAVGTFSLELTFPLNYAKGCAALTVGCQWYPWTDISTSSMVTIFSTAPSHPTPILSDIEFTDQGDMILGLTDRTGFQYGVGSPLPTGMPTDATVGTVFAGGDMLRAAFDPVSGSYTLESNGISGGVVGAGSGNNEGPGGGEFYTASTAGVHFELSQGGLAVFRGSEEFVVSAMDPLTTSSGGLLWMHDLGLTPGAFSAGYTLFDISTPSAFQKGAGVGDLELRCDEAPIELGHRVWEDSDLDGIQDPSEPAIPNVDVQLVCDGVGIDVTTTTDAQGHYVFNSNNVPGGIPHGVACEIRIDPSAPGLSGQGATVANAGMDSHDSDGILSAGFVSISLVTGGPGANRHDYDFGFGPADLTLTKTSTDGAPGQSLTYTLTVFNEGPGAAEAVTVMDNVPSGFLDPVTVGCANDPDGVPFCDLGTIAGNSSASFDIIGTVDPNLQPGTILANTASVTSTSTESTVTNNSGSANVTLASVIPTLAEWRLMAFALFLAMAGVYAVRQRLV